jgi:hypothetical protein
VHEARLGTDDLGEMGEEGDDVVLGLALDLVRAASFGITPSSASASAACASISNQILKRVCGSQIEAISWRV